MTPLSPPIINIVIKPTAKSSGDLILMEPPQRVPIQLNIFTPVGIAMAMVPTLNTALA